MLSETDLQAAQRVAAEMAQTSLTPRAQSTLRALYGRTNRPAAAA